MTQQEKRRYRMAGQELKRRDAETMDEMINKLIKRYAVLLLQELLTENKKHRKHLFRFLADELQHCTGWNDHVEVWQKYLESKLKEIEK